MKRIFVGSFLTFSLVSVGTTYALTDSDSAVSKWYERTFLETSNTIERTTANDWDASLEKVTEDIHAAAVNLTEQILVFQSGTTAESEDSIKAQRDHYIQQLQASKEILIQQNKNEMQLYKEQAKESATTQIAKDAETLLIELLNEQ